MYGKRWNFFLLLMLLVAGPAGGQAGLPLDKYLPLSQWPKKTQCLLEQALTTKAFRELEPALFTHLAPLDPTVDGKKVPVMHYLHDRGNDGLSTLVQAYVQGHEAEEAPRLLPALLDLLEPVSDLAKKDGRLKLEEEIKTLVRRATMDRRVFDPFTQVSDLSDGLPNIELLMVFPDKLLKGFPAGLDELQIERWEARVGQRPLLQVRSQQVDMAKAILQYADRRSLHDVLEIGYGTANIMTTLHGYRGKTRFTGVDILEVPQGANELLAGMNIELLRGRAPKEEGVTDEIKARGPYDLIYSVDTIQKVIPGAKNNDFGVPPRQYAQWLFDSLRTGGQLLILNDFRRDPYFSEDDAIAVGFKKVRWQEPRDLGPISQEELVKEVRQIPDFRLPRELAGHLSLFLLVKP